MEMKTIKSDGVCVKKDYLETLEMINIVHEIKKSKNVLNSNLKRISELDDKSNCSEWNIKYFPK